MSAFLLFAFVASAQAGTIQVTRTDDPAAGVGVTCPNDGTIGDCSLRHGIAAAASGDTIHVPGNANHYVLTQGALIPPSNNMFIVGDGAKSSIVDGNANGRVFQIDSDATVFMRDLTVTNGNVPVENDGGGILVKNSSSLSLTRVAVTGNTAGSNGGGIAYENDSGGKGLAIDHSEISGNAATLGGGIFVSGQGVGTPIAPAAANRFGIATAHNADIGDTTIAGNNASFEGGGIQASPPTQGSPNEVIDLLNDTIANNTTTRTQNTSPRPSAATGAFGAGLDGFSSDFLVADTIIAQNRDTSNGNGLDNCASVNIVSQDYNLSDDSTCQFTNTHDKVVTDAKLGPLADNGGQTKTMALLTGSAAIDGSDSNGCLSDDQRGVSRPQGPACDTGAFERVLSADLALTKTVSPASVTVGLTVTYTLTSTNNGPDAAANTVVTDTLPSGVAFVSHTASQGSCTGTTTITCHLGTVASGSHATATIVVRVTSVGSFLNSANVTGDPADPNTANNTATARVTGTPPPSTCADTRRFTFHLHKFHNARIVDAVLFINGVRKAHRKGHDLKTITIARLPLGNFTVKIVSTQSTHSTLTSTRHYFGCKKGRPKTKAHHAHRHHHHHHG